jgi:hypothetical protein
MAFRTFLDSAGQEWQAYDVTPPADERRRYDRRSTSESVEPERRSQDDRRLSVGRVSRLASGTGGGWLCFERGDDRRRLTPIPENWERSSDEQLEQYRDSARPVPTVPGTGHPASRKP